MRLDAVARSLRLDVAVRMDKSYNGFYTAVMNGDEVVDDSNVGNRWEFGRNCSMDGKPRIHDLPYASEVLQNIINSYRVDELSVKAYHDTPDEAAKQFRDSCCKDLDLFSLWEGKAAPGKLPDPQKDGMTAGMDSRFRRSIRMDMVSTCCDRMRDIADVTEAGLADMAAAYFDKNRTMPGEKRIKDIAMAQREAARQYRQENKDDPFAPNWKWNQGVDEQYTIGRNEFISGMAKIGVKDVELRGDSYPRRLTEDALHFRTLLQYRLPDAKETHCNAHEFGCGISGEGRGQTILIDDGDQNRYKAAVPQGFAANHPQMTGMTGIVTAVDPSRGKGGDANLVFSIDLMQGESLSLELTRDWKEKATDTDDDLDFAQAVARLPVEREKPAMSWDGTAGDRTYDDLDFAQAVDELQQDGMDVGMEQ